MAIRPIMPNLANPHSAVPFIQALSQLKSSGVSLENVRLLLKGVFESYRGEIVHQLPPPGEVIDSSSVILLFVASSSMVDRLPPSLFLAPKEKYTDYSSMELESRKLFSCFDSTIIKMAAILKYAQLVYNSVFAETSFARQFVRAFGFPDEGWSPEELFLWANLLPSYHQWGGTRKGTEEVLSRFLQTKVRIEEKRRGENPLPPELFSRLGRKASRLGSDWSLGSRYSECESTFGVMVGPISALHVHDFLPSGPKRKKLDRILKHCVPGQLRWKVTVRLRRSEKSFSLGQNTANCILGYTTHLMN
jgi:hypothetical protein